MTKKGAFLWDKTFGDAQGGQKKCFFGRFLLTFV